MHPFLRNPLAVIVGWLVGSIVNMSLINCGHVFFPIEGLDPNNFKQLAEMMPDFTPEFFVFPFLAHALGTLVGAALAVLISTSKSIYYGIGIGVVFLIGGISVNYMLPGPTWFTALDIIVAYLPMAYLGGKIFAK